MTNTNRTAATNGIAQHINLSAQYGCRAWMTVASFTAHGVKHVARRFFREDMETSGKIELYTVAPDRDASSAFSEDWLGYAVAGTRTASLAAAALNEVDSIIAADQAARVAGIELR